MSLSVCLQTYARPSNLQQQINACKNQTDPPDEIIIGHAVNDKTSEFDFPKEHKLIKYYRDPGIWAKFLTALNCQNGTDYIAVLDDDMIPGRQWFEQARSLVDEEPGLYGGCGMDVDLDFWRNYRAVRGKKIKNEDRRRVDFIGQSWFLPYDLLNYFFTKRIPSDRTSIEDIYFSYRCWEEGFYSYLPPFPSNNSEVWPVISRPLETGPMAIHKKNTSHEDERIWMIEHLIDEGWETINGQG